MQRTTTLAAMAALAILLVAGLTLPTQAQRLDAPATYLPSARSNAALLYDDRFVYVVGGTGCMNFCDDVMRFDPVAETTFYTEARMPSARSYTSGIWDGQFGYIFGGSNNETFLGDILRYNPATDTFTVHPTRLPPIAYTSAVWDGAEHAYVVGGCNLSRSDTIYRFTPATGSLVEMDATLPTPRCGTMAFWANDTVYIMGGRDATGRLDTIVAYDPFAGDVRTLPARMTEIRSSPGVAYDGHRYAYIFGGATNNDTLASVDRFDTWTHTIDRSPSIMPAARWENTAIWAADRAYIFGGFLDAGWYQLTDQILRFDPNGVPLNRTTDPDAGLNTTDEQDIASGDARPPAAWFGYARNQLNLSVDGSASADPDGNLTDFVWTWGDGALADGGAQADHAYAQPGNYTVTLQVTDDQGLDSHFSRTIAIGQTDGSDGDDAAPAQLPDRPLARFGIITDGLSVTVDGRASTSGDGAPLVYRWEWGDDSEPVDGATAVHRFAGPGSYRISLTVMDSHGQIHRSDEVVPLGANEGPAATPAFELPVPTWTVWLAAAAIVAGFVVWSGYRRGLW